MSEIVVTLQDVHHGSSPVGVFSSLAVPDRPCPTTMSEDLFRDLNTFSHLVRWKWTPRNFATV